MLDIIGERLVENISVAFPDLMRALCEASLVQLDYIPMGQIIEGLPQNALLAVGTGHPFEGEIMLAIDRTLFMTSVELMLGGTAKQINDDDDDEYTAIELAFGERLWQRPFWRNFNGLCPWLAKPRLSLIAWIQTRTRPVWPNIRPFVRG